MDYLRPRDSMDAIASTSFEARALHLRVFLGPSYPPTLLKHGTVRRPGLDHTLPPFSHGYFSTFRVLWFGGLDHVPFHLGPSPMSRTSGSTPKNGRQGLSLPRRMRGLPRGGRPAPHRKPGGGGFRGPPTQLVQWHPFSLLFLCVGPTKNCLPQKEFPFGRPGSSTPRLRELSFRAGLGLHCPVLRPKSHGWQLRLQPAPRAPPGHPLHSPCFDVSSSGSLSAW